MAASIDAARKDRSVDECWPWPGTVNSHGYGQFSWFGPNEELPRRTQANASRVAFHLMNGAVPDGFHVDHVCRNRRCVNPSHLRAVSPRDNYLLGVGPSAENARKERCVRGHSLSGENLYARNGRRHCRACRAEYAVARRRRDH